MFSTLGANNFSYFVVTEDFFTGVGIPERYDDNCEFDGVTLVAADTSDVPQFSTVYQAYRADKYSRRLEVTECVNEYSSEFVTQRSFLAVTRPKNGMRMAPGCAFSPAKVNLTDYYGPDVRPSKSQWYGYGAYDDIGYPQPLWNGSSVLGYNYNQHHSDRTWLCDGYDTMHGSQGGSTNYMECPTLLAQQLLAENGTFYLRPRSAMSSDDFGTYPIEYCLTEDEVPELCQLQYSTYILVVVICCISVKLVCITVAAFCLWDLKEPIFATVGDAVASYLERPDETTKGWCLLDHQHVGSWSKSELASCDSNRYSRKPVTRMWAATSNFRLLTTIGICMLYLAVGVYLLQRAKSLGATDRFVTRGYSGSAIWKTGFGTIDQLLMIGSQGNTASGRDLLKNVLTANAFQLVLSTSYFLFNSLFTAQCGALEWSSYTDPATKALRVTWPRGEQRSTYYLHLPYRYGIPLTTMLMLMHFLISRSIFVVRVQWYNSHGNYDGRDGISNIGFSPVAILVTICVGVGLVLTLIMHSIRPLNNRIPMHGNSSVVISAMCHPEAANGPVIPGYCHGSPPAHPVEDVASRKLMWGASVQPSEHDGIGHCSFTANNVEMPVQGKKYE